MGPLDRLYPDVKIGRYEIRRSQSKEQQKNLQSLWGQSLEDAGETGKNEWADLTILDWMIWGIVCLGPLRVAKNTSDRKGRKNPPAGPIVQLSPEHLLR